MKTNTRTKRSGKRPGPTPGEANGPIAAVIDAHKAADIASAGNESVAVSMRRPKALAKLVNTIPTTLAEWAALAEYFTSPEAGNGPRVHVIEDVVERWYGGIQARRYRGSTKRDPCHDPVAWFAALAASLRHLDAATPEAERLGKKS